MITWIASYPKCGNTWVRMLLSSIITGEGYGNSIDTNLILRGSDTSKAMYDSFGVGLTSDDHLAKRERLLELCSVAKKNLILKTHSAYLSKHALPLIPSEITSRAVLVVRNPLDAICSAMNHFGKTESEAVDLFSGASSTLVQTEKQYSCIISSWDIFYSSWIAQKKDFPVLIIRYEDLHLDAVGCCETLCSFLELDMYKGNIAPAVAANNFKLVKEAESKFGFSERPNQSLSFFNRGEVGQFRDYLSKDCISHVVGKFDKTMRAFGYYYDIFDGSFKLRKMVKSIY